MSDILRVRCPEPLAEELATYCEQHDLSTADALRIGIARLLKRQPTKAEREAADLPRGNPNAAEQAAAANAARWGKPAV